MNVTIKTSVGGTNIFDGDTLTLVSARTRAERYACTRPGHYADGAEVPVTPVDGAPDLVGGEHLTWDHPRPGCAYEVVAVKPFTRADFDRLERKVDDLAARLEKFFPGGTQTIKIHVDTSELERARNILGEMATFRENAAAKPS